MDSILYVFFNDTVQCTAVGLFPKSSPACINGTRNDQCLVHLNYILDCTVFVADCIWYVWDAKFVHKRQIV